MVFGVSKVRLGCSTIRDNAALPSKNAVTNRISRISCFSTYLWSCKTYTSNKFLEVLKYVFCLFGITVRCILYFFLCMSFINETTNSHCTHTQIRKGKILVKLVTAIHKESAHPVSLHSSRPPLPPLNHSQVNT